MDVVVIEIVVTGVVVCVVVVRVTLPRGTVVAAPDFCVEAGPCGGAIELINLIIIIERFC